MAEKKPVSQQAVRQGPVPWRTQTQTAAIAALILVIAIIIGSLYLAQATTTATTGQELQQLSATRDNLQRDNEDLLAAIAFAKSISLLRGRAQALGFEPVEADRLQYLVVDGYSPLRASPTPEITAQPSFVYDETFTGWVQQQWNNISRQFEAWTGREQRTPTPNP